MANIFSDILRPVTGPVLTAGVAAPAKGVWSPAKLGDALYDMWDAEAASSLTLAGSAVNAWASLKNGYSASQSLSASKPVYASTDFNGRPSVTFDGADDFLSFEGVGVLPTGAGACEIWALVDQTRLAAVTATGFIFSYGGTSANNRRRLTRTVDTGVNRALIGVGNGSAEITRTNPTVDFSGRKVARAIVSATAEQVDIDGTAGTSAAVVPATGTVRTRLGSSTTDVAAGFFAGKISLLAITAPLSADQATRMLSYLKARGGIA